MAGTEKKTDETTWVGGDEGIVVAHFRKDMFGKRKNPFDDRRVEIHGFTLGDRNALARKSGLHIFIEFFLEQNLTWAERIR